MKWCAFSDRIVIQICKMTAYILFIHIFRYRTGFLQFKNSHLVAMSYMKRHYRFISCSYMLYFLHLKWNKHINQTLQKNRKKIQSPKSSAAEKTFGCAMAKWEFLKLANIASLSSFRHNYLFFSQEKLSF